MIYVFSVAAILVLLTSVYFLLRRRPHALFVLAYEKVGHPPAHSRLKKEWVTPHKLEKTLLWLRHYGFTPVSLQTLRPGAKRPSKPVLLAFMGGYQSFMTKVFPLLEKYNMPAAVFLPPALAGTYNAWQDPHLEPWQNLLTEKQLKALQKSGLVSFGAISLEGEDLTLLKRENASFLLQESFFRLHKQLGLQADGFAFWPARRFNIREIAHLLPDGFKFPVLLPEKGINQVRKKTLFLKTLSPVRNPFFTHYALWKRR